MNRFTSILSLFLMRANSIDYTGCVSTGIDRDFTLNGGDSIFSPDGDVSLRMQEDGNLCLYTNVNDLLVERFCTYTLQSGDYLDVSVTGNLFVLDSSDEVLWEALNDTSILPPYNSPISLCVDNCGKAFLYDIEDNVLWESDYTNNDNPALGGYPIDKCSNPSNPVLLILCIDSDYETGRALLPQGTTIYSPNTNVRLVMQYDGNLCLNTLSDDGVTWIVRYCTYKLGASQSGEIFNGNLRIVDGDEVVFSVPRNFTSIMPPYPSMSLCVSDCGKAFLFSGGNEVWNTTYNTNVIPTNCSDVTGPTPKPTIDPTMEPTLSPVEESPDAVNRITISMVVAFWMVMVFTFLE